MFNRNIFITIIKKQNNLKRKILVKILGNACKNKTIIKFLKNNKFQI